MRIFTLLFLNSDFSINICSISVNFLENVAYPLPEGSVSQNFDLSPSYFFMLCRNLGKLLFKILRHSSLEMNVIKNSLKSFLCIYNIK